MKSSLEQILDQHRFAESLFKAYFRFVRRGAFSVCLNFSKIEVLGSGFFLEKRSNCQIFGHFMEFFDQQTRFSGSRLVLKFVCKFVCKFGFNNVRKGKKRWSAKNGYCYKYQTREKTAYF